VRGGFHRLKSQYIEELPIPTAPPETRARLATLAETAQRAAEQRRDLLQAFRRRVLTDLAPGGATAKLNNKLADWPALDFKAFHDEVKKQFKQTIPLAERDAWQTRFEADKARVVEFSAEISRCEREIDTLVYRLFDLTAEEIALVEGGPALAADAAACDDSGHVTQPYPADRPETEAVAHPASGRSQPARRLSGQGAGVHAEFDGAGERASGSAAAASPTDSTQPLDATRALETANGPKPYSEVAEALAENVARCLDELLEAQPEDIAIVPDWLQAVHRRIAGELFPDWAGRWRTTDVQVGTHLPPPPHDVPVHVRNFCLDLEERLRHPGNAAALAELLAWAEWRFQWIHPFRDFNGRVGRILLVALAYRLGLPPLDASVSDAGRTAYFEALRAADHNDLRPLTRLWLSRLGK